MNQAELHPSSTGMQPGWRLAWPALALALLLILLFFRDTALAMTSIWARSDTYAHGFIVPPITLWLIWRMRARIAVLAPKPSYLAVLLLAVTGFVWLLAELAAVNVVSQFALTAILVLAVPAVVGWEVTRRIAFPLLFLFFAVPFGDFAMPKLMEWTAQFTILGLRLSGIPVLSEGLHFVIPSGSWSVVEACSGVRYLIASVTVGTLFAYLTYQSLRRRLIFVAISVIVPIVANWFRAYMIVMLGHLSGNKLAVGVDHLIYGWVFFGIVIMAMFWIGARWREDELPLEEPATVQIAKGATVAAVWVAAAAAVLAAALGPLLQRQLDSQAAVRPHQMAPLGSIAGWQSSPQELNDWHPRFANYAASSQATFENGGRQAGLFLAYYRNQDQQHKLVSSTNVLVTSDDPVWTRVAGGTREITLDQQPISVRTTELLAVGSTRMQVWQWYWVSGRWTSSDTLAKAYAALSRLTGKGDDSAVVIVYATQSAMRGADATLDDFVHAAGPVIEAALMQTMGAR